MKLTYWFAAARGALSLLTFCARQFNLLKKKKKYKGQELFFLLMCACKHYSISMSYLRDQGCSCKEESWNSFIWDLTRKKKQSFCTDAEQLQPGISKRNYQTLKIQKVSISSAFLLKKYTISPTFSHHIHHISILALIVFSTPVKLLHTHSLCSLLF